jgi:hypothetical protein
MRHSTINYMAHTFHYQISFAHSSKNLPTVRKPDGSLPPPQKPITLPNPESAQTIPKLQIHFS